MQLQESQVAHFAFDSSPLKVRGMSVSTPCDKSTTTIRPIFFGSFGLSSHDLWGLVARARQGPTYAAVAGQDPLMFAQVLECVNGWSSAASLFAPVA